MAKKSAKKPPVKGSGIGINYSSMSILSFSINEIIYTRNETDQTHFSYSIKGEIDKDLSRVIVNISVSLTDVKTKIELGAIKTRHLFKYVDEEGIIEKNDTALPDSLARKISEDAFSTTRGVLAVKLMGTPLQDDLLPLIDLDSAENEAD